MRPRLPRPSLRRRIAGPGHCRACNLEDFSSPYMRDVIRAIFPHDVERFGVEFPAGHEYRKHWEVASSARALAAAGVLRGDAQVLGVGAGNEGTVFWLTTRVGRVFATDRYLDAGVWAAFAHPSMLTDPGRHWPAPWNPRRLVVQHMDALDLAYDDDTFDAVFSCGSIEHVGGHDEVRRALAEMNRVLRPGGVLSLATELRLAGPSPGLPGTLMFDADELRELMVDPFDWEPMSPWDLRVSPATRASAVSAEEHVADFTGHIALHGLVVPHELDFAVYPQVALRSGDHAWPSVQRALRRPSSRGRRLRGRLPSYASNSVRRPSGRR